MHTKEVLDKAIEEWRQLADDQQKSIDLGIVHKSTGNAKIDTYLRTVKALEIQRDTGVTVCSCHFKPFKENS